MQGEASYLQLSYGQVLLATLLILINGGVSLALQLGLERRLLYAAVRMTVQLLLVGLVLRWVFAQQQWFVVVGLASVMASVAGVAAVRRVKHRYRGIWLDSVISVWASSWFVTGLALTLILPVRPWYLPQYAIPLLGMVLGNTLTGISLGLDRIGEDLTTQRLRVETLLALGATRWEAASPSIQQAIRTAMIPTLNTMMVVGIVSLPGLMTGQLLAGVDPVQAVKYQIVIMFLIASGTALGTMGVVLFSYRRLFNAAHQFLYWRIRN